MSPKLMRLIGAVQTRANERGLLQKDLAGFVGMSPTQISLALRGQAQLPEERWRIICEKLDLDYDQVVAPEEGEAQPAEQEPTGPERLVVETDQEDLFLLVQYLEGRIQADVKAGMEVETEKLYRLLRTLYALKEAALRK